MDISLTALSLVDHDASPLASRLEENLETSVQRFFVEHILALIKKSKKTDSPPPGRFVDTEAQDVGFAIGDVNEFVAIGDDAYFAVGVSEMEKALGFAGFGDFAEVDG